MKLQSRKEPFSQEADPALHLDEGHVFFFPFSEGGGGGGTSFYILDQNWLFPNMYPNLLLLLLLFFPVNA